MRVECVWKARGGKKGAALAAIIRYKLSIRLSCHHASNRHCSRCPHVSAAANSWRTLPLRPREPPIVVGDYFCQRLSHGRGYGDHVCPKNDGGARDAHPIWGLLNGRHCAGFRTKNATRAVVDSGSR
jgi:hypothetical protein